MLGTMGPWAKRAWAAAALTVLLAASTVYGHSNTNAQPLPGMKRPQRVPGPRRLPVMPDPNRPLTDPFNCTGWPEPRQYIEGQVWFTPGTGNPDSQSRHLHTGACMPFNQTLRGLVRRPGQ